MAARCATCEHYEGDSDDPSGICNLAEHDSYVSTPRTGAAFCLIVDPWGASAYLMVKPDHGCNAWVENRLLPTRAPT